jgi:hypothetical protein
MAVVGSAETRGRASGTGRRLTFWLPSGSGPDETNRAGRPGLHKHRGRVTGTAPDRQANCEGRNPPGVVGD